MGFWFVRCQRCGAGAGCSFDHRVLGRKVIQLTEAMFDDAKRMAALDERRRIKQALHKFVLRSGDRILLVNFEGDLGLLDKDDFHHLDAIFKNGNGHSTSA